ncbi:hypothetical protein V2G26_001567 [Clonostachys chloroleuca]
MSIDKGVESPVTSEVGNEEAVVQYVVIEEEISIDPEEETKLFWKTDLRVMPLFFSCISSSTSPKNTTILCLAIYHCFIVHWIGITWEQPKPMASIQTWDSPSISTISWSQFFMPLIAPNILTRKLSARWTLPSYLLFWGATVILSPACHNFGGLAALRILLGVAEAGFGVGGVFYLTQFYKRDELAKRIALFYGSQTVSGAFSGLIAFGVFQIKGSLYGWQYLYLVWAFIAFCFGVTNSSVGNFTSLIVAKLGYNAVRTNLYTVVPYLVSAVILFATAVSSDHFGERTCHLISAFTMSCVGFIIIASIDVEKYIGVAYFAVFRIVGGCFTPSIIFHSWHQNNMLSENRRAFNIAFITFFGNAAGLVSSNVFTPDSGPKYIPALVTNYAFRAAAILATLSMRHWMQRQKALRNKAQGVNWTSADVPTHLLIAISTENPHQNPNFRFVI